MRGRHVQERHAPDPATIIGSGLLARIAQVCEDEGIRSVVFDEDLTGTQVRNLEKVLPEGVKVLDRAAVILDIFAQRARSREAQTQVELAQLSYLLPRLTRRWSHLSRQAGGIGTRGVGETQLEIDRRLISKRIALLRDKLEVIERDRRQRRQRRAERPTLALVGYTNAGKSSLFTRFAGSSGGVEDRLFATLDPRARRAALGDDLTAVVVDTVGFIRKLPHHLVAPFRSTLEEATEASLLLHVVDAAHPGWEDQLAVGNEVLDDLEVEPERRLVVLNKVDLAAAADARLAGAVRVSAVSGEGLDQLREVVRGRILAGPDVVFLRVPLERAEVVERAMALPNRLARRFGAEQLELAVRLDRRRLADSGLVEFRVDSWSSPDGRE